MAEGAVEAPRATVVAPETYMLQQNHPNPFNPSATIRFALLHSGPVRLRVFDLAGNEVAVLVDGQREQGQHQVAPAAGNPSTGVYFYRLEINGFAATRKLLLVKLLISIIGGSEEWTPRHRPLSPFHFSFLGTKQSHHDSMEDHALL